MKRYYIEIYYETGSSFGSSTETKVLRERWDDLNIAKKNLKRIKEHNEWYLKDTEYLKYSYVRNNSTKKPVPPDFLNSGGYAIDLLTDDGDVWGCSPSWCGYFETLYSANIKEEPDSELSYTTVEGGYM